MSLINDALKRASKSRLPVSTPSASSSARTADRAAAKGLPKFFLPISLLIFAASIWILFKGVQTQQALTSVDASVPVAAREGQPPLPPPELLEAISKEHPEFRPIAEKFLRNELTPAKLPEQPPFSIPEAPPSPSPQLLTSTIPAPSPSPSAAPTSQETPLPPAAQPQPGSVSTSPQAYKLGGIIYRPSKPAAVVNNRTVYVGDRVGSARVKSIQRDGVVLQLPDGKDLELLLN